MLNFVCRHATDFVEHDTLLRGVWCISSHTLTRSLTLSHTLSLVLHNHSFTCILSSLSKGLPAELMQPVIDSLGPSISLQNLDDLVCLWSMCRSECAVVMTIDACFLDIFVFSDWLQLLFVEPCFVWPSVRQLVIAHVWIFVDFVGFVGLCAHH